VCGHGKTGCSLAAGRSPRRPSPASCSGRRERSFADRGGRGFRDSARDGEPLDGAGGECWAWGAESATARTASGFALGTPSSRHGGAPYSERLPGPVELALCAVDPGSRARIVVAKIRAAGFGVDGGTLLASLGSNPAEAGAPSVGTKSGGGTEMVRGRISSDSRTGTTV
jgi:hypothetical protein